MIILCLTIWETARLFSEVVASFCIPFSSTWSMQVFHILANTCYYLFWIIAILVSIPLWFWNPFPWWLMMLCPSRIFLIQTQLCSSILQCITIHKVESFTFWEYSARCYCSLAVQPTSNYAFALNLLRIGGKGLEGQSLMAPTLPIAAFFLLLLSATESASEERWVLAYILEFAGGPGALAQKKICRGIGIFLVESSSVD